MTQGKYHQVPEVNPPLELGSVKVCLQDISGLAEAIRVQSVEIVFGRWPPLRLGRLGKGGALHARVWEWGQVASILISA
eukprot:1161712-Pelagomonas_calceolata.AAC.12